MKERLLRCILLIAESNLKNTATALEMWLTDHNGRYPGNLLELTPNYLRQILPGPSGSPEDWIYEPSPDGSAYSLATRGECFAALGVPAGYPRFDPVGGTIEPKMSSDIRESLDYRFTLPASLADWQPYTVPAAHQRRVLPAYWQRGGQTLLFWLSGPYSLTVVGMDWVEHKVAEHSRFAGTKHESQAPVRFEELSGIEVRGTCHHLRFHHFYLTDGELGWEFSYSAPAADFDEAVDRTFVEMIEGRQKP